MAELASARARRRARPSRRLARLRRAHGRGPGRRRRGPGRTDVDAVAFTHATTDGMNAGSLLPDWRAGGRVVTSAHEHGGALGPLYRAPRPDRGSMSSSSTPVPMATRRARSRPSMLRSPRTPVWSRSRMSCGRPGRSCRSPGSPRSPTRVAPSSSSTAPRPSARSRSASMTSAPTCYAIPAQKWLLGPEGMGALVVDPARVARPRPGARRLLRASSGSTRPATRPGGPTRGGSSRAAIHRPSIVGMARSIGWLSMYVGLDFVHRRGTALAAPRPPDAPGRHPRRDGPDPGPRDGDAGDVPDRRLAGRRPPSTSSASRVFAIARTIDEPRRAADQRRLLQLARTSSSASPTAVELLAGAHARDAPAAARPDDPGRADDRPPPIRPTRPAAALVGRGPLAPVPARAAAGRPRRGRQPDRGDRPGHRLPCLRRRARAAARVLPGGDLRTLAVDRLRGPRPAHRDAS